MTFKGSVGEVSNKIDAFIRSKEENPIGGRSYFALSLEEAETASKFTNGFAGGITYDLSPIIGQTRVLFNDTDGLLVDYYYQGDFQTDAEGDRTAASSGMVSFALIKISVVTIILTVLFAACVIVGAVLLIVNRNQIVELVQSIAAKKPVATATDASAEDAVAPSFDSNEVSQPVNEQSASEEEETEEIL